MAGGFVLGLLGVGLFGETDKLKELSSSSRNRDSNTEKDTFNEWDRFEFKRS
jgi:hypothetical protein